MPAHLIQAMPMLVLGMAALVWIAGRWALRRRAGHQPSLMSAGQPIARKTPVH